jgi:hypothetical protein
LRTTPDLESFDNVVLTLARPRPVPLATSPAVIALPELNASKTAVLVPADRVRPPFAVRASAPERASADVRGLRGMVELDEAPDR